MFSRTRERRAENGAAGRRADTFMPARESEAIILRTYPLGEADRLVSFLSRTSGRLRGVAAGARRTKSRFGSTLELLSHVRIWFFERETRELVRINQCELVESFLNAQQDYQRSLGLAFLSEVTENVLPEREASDAMFRLILLTARAIQEHAATSLPMAYFALWTVRLGGWLPQLDHCSRCGRELGAAPSYRSAFSPGLLCSDCRPPGSVAVSPETRKLAKRMTTEKLDQLLTAKIPDDSVEQLREFMLDLIEHQTEKKLTTRRLSRAAGEI
jgi:DNA repair protein RecO (recombination protein O)